jgi:prevent-host-death family protein
VKFKYKYSRQKLGHRAAESPPPVTYSVAESRNKLAQVLREAETAPVTITRRGEPVAVVVSFAEYQRLRSRPAESLWEITRRHRARWDALGLDIDPDEIWGDVRDRSPGREFSFDD